MSPTSTVQLPATLTAAEAETCALLMTCSSEEWSIFALLAARLERAAPWAVRAERSVFQYHGLRDELHALTRICSDPVLTACISPHWDRVLGPYQMTVHDVACAAAASVLAPRLAAVDPALAALRTTLRGDLAEIRRISAAEPDALPLALTLLHEDAATSSSSLLSLARLTLVIC